MLRVETLCGGPFYTNSYYVIDRKQKSGFLIDPGIEVRRVVDYGKERGYTISHVLITHGHVDHVMGANWAAQTYEAELYFPERDRYLAGGEFLGTRFDAPEGSLDLVGGEELTIADHRVKVLHTPGHTPGSVSFLVDDELLFDGDTLMARAIGRTDLPGGDGPLLLRSIHEVILSLPENVAVYPGHGEQTTVGRERAANPFLR